MATIPIEVIVQDAEAPVVPNEDGTNNTETNITVPDTGTISSNGETSSSASSIILPAILLVLAIGSIVAMLIHKYHKQKKDKSSKKEKLATTAAITIAILVATVLVSNLILPATKAATSDVTNGIVPAEDKVSIVVTRDGGVAEASVENTATITSTSAFGYKVLLSMAEGVETTNLYLNGDETSEYYIASVEVESEEGTELTDNTWGYALVENSEYSAVPPVDNSAIVAQGDGPVEAEDLSIYYGVKVSSDLPAGTYSGGEIEYSLVSLEPTISTLTYMQDFSKLSADSKSSVLRSMTEDQQYYLKDNRDNKTYRIAKLKDGNVWMTQNLDLEAEGIKQGTTLNSDNTDYPVINFTLPASQTSGSGGWCDGTITSTCTDTPHVYSMTQDVENPYKYCLDFPGWGSCREWGDAIPEEELGNLYNWYAATAGTGTYSTGSTEEGPFEATGSICPAGWRLPNSSNSHGATDYSTLLYLYGITQSATDSSYISTDKVAIYKAPFLFVPTGGYYNSGLDDVGEEGYLWSSLASGSTDAKNFLFHSGSVAFWSNYGSKAAGRAVRCLTR